MVQLILFREPNGRAVITLQSQAGGWVKSFCHGADVPGIFGMLKKKGNERETQAGFTAFGEGSHQPRRIFVKRFYGGFSAYEKVHPQRVESADELIAGESG